MGEENQGAAGVGPEEIGGTMRPETPGHSVDMNSLAYWFPILHKIPGIKFPATGIVNTDRWPDMHLEQILDGKMPGPGYQEFLGHLRILAHGLSNIETNKFFLRTGHMSGKHSWKHTCCCSLDRLEELEAHVATLVDESACAGFLGLPFNIWVVREFLPLAHQFRAFNDMPVAKEIRFFVDSSEVKCWHWYWPPGSIQHPNAPNWMDLLRLQQQISNAELAPLILQASEIAKVFGGAWSIDMAMHTDGTWYVIDMALAKDSFHWIECENCPPAMRAQYADLASNDASE